MPVLQNSEMIPGRGALITIEGGDGSGKGTQTTLLYEYLQSFGIPVQKGSYPMYDTPTGKKVAAYLNGDMGEDIPAEIAGKLFTDDRLANKGPLESWVRHGGVRLQDRYVESNSGHQGGKLPTKEARIAYIKGNAEIEYGTNGLIMPDLTLLFTLAPDLAREYVAKKAKRDYTDLTHDIHENDPFHLQNANESFLLLKELYPERVHHIDITAEDGKAMRSREEISQDVIKAVRPLLELKGFHFTR
jgi:dTMP kinase